jgi:hypothetical protein
MSTIALELDLTLQSLDQSASSSLTTIVREAIHLVKASSSRNSDKPKVDVNGWLQRLEARSEQLSTGRLGVPLQQVMDDLR